MLRRGLLAAALLIALPTAAHAGGYVSAGLGTQPSVSGDVSTMMTVDGNSGRVALGQSFGPVSLEGGVGGFSVASGSAVSADIALKLQASISGPLGFFARGSLDRTWLRSDTMDASGDGHTLGVGLDYGLKFVASAGVWLEADRQWLDLGGTQGTADTVTAGLRFGI